MDRGTETAAATSESGGPDEATASDDFKDSVVAMEAMELPVEGAAADADAANGGSDLTGDKELREASGSCEGDFFKCSGAARGSCAVAVNGEEALVSGLASGVLLPYFSSLKLSEDFSSVFTG